MAVTFFAASALGAIAATPATLSVAYPASVAAGDIAFIRVLSKNITLPANELNTPAGYTLLGSLGTVDSAVAADDFRYGVFWKRLDGSENGTSVTVSRAGTSTLGFYALMDVFRAGSGSLNDPLTPAVTPTTVVADTITFPAFTPGVACHAIYLGFYANDLTTAGTIAGTDPTLTNRVDLETATGTDCTMITASGDSSGAAIGSRTQSTTSTADSSSLGFVTALVEAAGGSAPRPAGIRIVVSSGPSQRRHRRHGLVAWLLRAARTTAPATSVAPSSPETLVTRAARERASRLHHRHSLRTIGLARRGVPIQKPTVTSFVLTRAAKHAGTRKRHQHALRSLFERSAGILVGRPRVTPMIVSRAKETGNRKHHRHALKAFLSRAAGAVATSRRPTTQPFLLTRAATNASQRKHHRHSLDAFTARAAGILVGRPAKPLMVTRATREKAQRLHHRHTLRSWLQRATGFLTRRPLRPITVLSTVRIMARRKHRLAPMRGTVDHANGGAVAAIRRAALLLVSLLARRTARRRHRFRGVVRTLRARVVAAIAAVAHPYRGTVTSGPRLTGVVASGARLDGTVTSTARETATPLIANRLDGTVASGPRLTGTVTTSPA